MGKLFSPAIFLDRDGTIMRDVDYCGDPANVHVFEGVPAALARLQKAGFKIIVVTNQSGIARGLFDEADYRAVEAEVERQVGDGVITATYYCPHLPEADCRCRKPSPDMITAAAREHQIDFEQSFLIGDKTSDLECGRNAGIKTILVRTGYGNEANRALADFVADNLPAAADLILGRVLSA